MNLRSHSSRAFSLVEVLAAVGIIGIIAFLAIPNIVAIKQDSERNLAISRAEAVNMAIVSYIQSNGKDNVASSWSSKNNQARYAVLIPYLSFAPGTVTEFSPAGYTITLPANLNALTKSVLTDTSTSSAVSY
ncbi:MAG: prepilin-type N-terminal cleavage/methylation domain-containing protein [Verrucomicrobiales bacterium]|nr:prepilin-type N-terminal cleavage/methylation domain-containing protein [Verrucomicrobiales bacterium]